MAMPANRVGDGALKKSIKAPHTSTSQAPARQRTIQQHDTPTQAARTVGQKIEKDLQRFRKIVRGKVKSNLSKYIGKGEMIGKKGNDLVSIPIPSINPPQFRFGQKNSGGVGVGDGQPGQALTPAQGDDDGRDQHARGGDADSQIVPVKTSSRRRGRHRTRLRRNDARAP